MQKQALFLALLCLLSLPALRAQILFEKRYGDNLDNVDYAGGSMLTPDGGVIVGGYTERDKNYDAFVQKFHADGTEAWYKIYGGPGMELVSSGTPAAGGGYLFAGATLNPADGSLDALLFKVDENGDLLWWETFGDAAADVGLAVCQRTNGDILLLGATTQPDNQSAHFRAEFDSDGALLSSETYPAFNGLTEIKAAITSDGGYVAVLTSGDVFSSTTRIIKYTAALEPQWDRTGASLNIFTGSTVSGIFDVKATATGILLCANTSAGAHLLHLGLSNTLLWSHRAFSGFAYNAGLHVWPDETISIVTHTFNLQVKTLTAAGAVLDSINNSLWQISTSRPARFHFLDSETLYRTVDVENSSILGYNVARIEQINAPVVAWEQTVGKIVPPEVESSKAIASMPDGGFVILGTKEDSTGTNQVWLLRADPQGAVLWSRLFDVRTNLSSFQPGSLKIDAAGNSIVLAVTYGYDFINSINIAEYRLLKVSPNGDLLFIKTIATSSYDADFFGAVPLPDGGYIACVTYDEGNNATTPHLVRTDANANVLWTKAYSGRLVNDVIALPNGNLVGAGIKGSTPWMFATDADGNLIWEHNYSVGGNGMIYDLAIASDGHLLAAGYTASAIGTISAQMVAIKVAGTDGAKLWHSSHSKGPSTVWLSENIVPGPAGGAVLIGLFVEPPINPYNYVYGLFRSRISVSALDAQGNMVSDMSFGNDGTYPTAPSADRTPDGKVLLCATVNVGSSLADAWVAKIDINTATAIHQPHFEAELALSPNPAVGQTRISFTAPHTGPVLVRMFDANGREVLRTSGDKQTETWATPLALDGLATGLYRVQVVMREGQVTQSVAVSGK